jgi:hypothetical protein
MRTILSLFSFLALAAGLPASQQTITVTPQALTGWTVVGADPLVLASSPELLLPAGAQLAQPFKAAAVALKITTSPVIGTDPADFPILEIGSAALIFARDASGGKLTLLIRDQAPLDLPFSYALDADGRSTAPLVIGFSRQGTMVSIAMSGQMVQFLASPAVDPVLEVVASAGTAQAWDIAGFEVTVSDSSQSMAVSTGSQAASASVSSAGVTAQSSDAAAPPPAASLSASTGAPAFASNLSLMLARRTPSPISRMEIFTPPAVRHGQADVIHAAAAAPTHP